MPVNSSQDPSPAPWAAGCEAIVDVLVRAWRDVNSRVWEGRTDPRAKVLRTFRSRGDRYYSRRFAWFNMSITEVVGLASAEDQLQATVGERLEELDINSLSRLQQSVREACSVGPSAGEHGDVQAPESEHQRAALRWEIAIFEEELSAVLTRAPKLLAEIREHSTHSLRSLVLGGDAQGRWEALLYALRIHGFAPWEFMALCERRAYDPRNEMSYKKRQALRSKIDRIFKRMGHPKPSLDWGARGSLANACAPLSARRRFDADDDDTA